MSARNHKLYVVEDDPAYQKALCRLLTAAGHHVESFVSVEAFLAAATDQAPRCLILDIRLPGASGLDLQDELHRRGRRVPIIFLTGHGDIPMSVRAMRNGAVDFLTKPVQGAALLQSIERALALGAEWQAEALVTCEVCQCHRSLTPREREVFELVVGGHMNKEIAALLGTAVRTIKAHRASIMTKMKAQTLVDLVRSATRLGLCPPEARAACTKVQ